MAHVAVFRHAQGLTAGIRSFADSSLPAYERDAADVLTRRVGDFLVDRA